MMLNSKMICFIGFLGLNILQVIKAKVVEDEL